MKNLLISFSGGRTSAMMTKMLLDARQHWDNIIVLFANTGQEHDATLEFVKNCDEHFGFGTVWLEAVVNPAHGIGTTHRIVTFETASRSGAPFEDVIRKFGIPNKNFPNCTRETKLRPIGSFVRDLGWKNDYYTAIGIRADEMDRVNPDYAEKRIIYPLVDIGATKNDVIKWWKDQPFDLTIPEHYGNCKWCWKKSLRKHLTIAQESPQFFDFPERMERLYPNAGPGDFDRPRRFFRGSRTVAEIKQLAEADFEKFVDPNYLDQGGSCSDSCEIHAEEDER